ncbi:MAG: cell division protein FtsQ/DivIB [Myxococcota bacterium]
MRNGRSPRRGRPNGARGNGRRHRVIRERDARRAARRRLAAGAVLAATAGLIGYVAATAGPAAFGLGDEPGGVTTIAVQGVERLSPDSVAAASGIERGSKLERLDVEAVAGRLAAHPWIAAARARVLPDGTVLIRVEERRPVAVATRSDGEALWLDPSGRAFAPAPPAERAEARLPEISGARADELAGDADSPRLARGVALARLAAARGVPGPVHVALPGAPAADTRAGWVLRPHGLGLEAWLGSELARFPERVGRLARLLEEDPAGAARAAQIDLRFSGRAFLRFAEGGAAGRTSPSPDGADASGGA